MDIKDYPGFQPKITHPKHFCPQCSVWIRFLLILLEKNNHIVWTLCLDSDHSASAKEMFYSDAVAFFFFLTFLEDCKPENKRLLTLSIMTFISIYSVAIFFFYGKIWNGKNYPFANMNIVLQFGNGFLLAFARVSSSNKILKISHMQIDIFYHFKVCHDRRNGLWFILFIKTYIFLMKQWKIR